MAAIGAEPLHFFESVLAAQGLTCFGSPEACSLWTAPEKVRLGRPAINSLFETAAMTDNATQPNKTPVTRSL
jgi:hypothetical protein